MTKEQVIQDAIERQMYRMDRAMQAMGFGPMSPDEMRLVHSRISQAISQHAQSQSGLPDVGSRIYGQGPALGPDVTAQYPPQPGNMRPMNLPLRTSYPIPPLRTERL